MQETKSNTLLNALLHHCPELQALPRAGIIHRLDKDTSGLLVIAKTPLALKKLSQQIKKHSMLREYQAIVYGVFVSGGKVDLRLWIVIRYSANAWLSVKLVNRR